MFKNILYITVLILLVACSTHMPYVKAKIESNAFLNPNAYDQASPVVVTIYQLKSQTAFEQAGFFELTNNSQNVLGSDLLNKEEVEIRPEQKKNLKIELSASAHYIGVVVAFRNIDAAQWRQVKAIKPGKNAKITINLASQNLFVN